MELTGQVWRNIQFIFVGAVALICLLLVWTMVLVVRGHGADTQTTTTRSDETIILSSDSPNDITVGLTALTNQALNTIDSSKHAIGGGVRALGIAGKQLASATWGAVTFVGRLLFTTASIAVRAFGTVIAFTANVASTGVVFVISLPGNALEAISNTAAVSAVIRPTEHAPVPIIDPNSPELAEAKVAMTAVDSPKPAIDETPQWPIRGAVTTRFGVKHWPYQPTHTGIDISDGQRAGVTPIHPFKPGRVIEAGNSGDGLGNHVTLEHGNGVTSVYAHLSKISVVVGQEVSKETVLGTEGSTGTSTGTHLHFEIRVNGQAANPSEFIAGHP